MKSNPSREDDPLLRALLQEWKPDASLPPRFQEQVWRRIEDDQIEGSPVAALTRCLGSWMVARFLHASVATAYVAGWLVIGAGAGYFRAQKESSRINNQLSGLYVRAVDPFHPGPIQ